MDDLREPDATKELAKSIHPIHSTTVHRICSGQVVLSLATAVKELVENALDANATLIEVKLRDQGIEMIEVSDNGEGVTESNFEGLTAKYHTSKIREFSDLECVETFGFRGEALSSLCALSKMVITTRHRSVDCGTRLELDERGAITKKEISARPVGTTVQLTDLFGSLPVRKKEFTRNIKKEFAKMCQILQGYCLVATGVRIICTNQNQKGVKSAIITTNGAKSVLDNIFAVFGPKQRSDVLQIVSPVELGDKLTQSILEELEPNSSSDMFNNLEEELTRFSFNGWISSCHHGSGRSSKDRQFIFINSRPCEPKKITKMVNEIYHRFNGNQSPFVYLNIIVRRSEVDVNITPDKRQLLLNNEHLLLLILKMCLLKTFDNIPSTFKLQNLDLSSNATEKTSQIETIPNTKKFSQMLQQWKTTGRTDNPCGSENIIKRKVTTEVDIRNMKMRKIQEYLTQNRDDSAPLSDDDTLSTTMDQSTVDNDIGGMDSLSNSLNPPESTSTPERQAIKIENSPVKIIDTYNGVANPSKSKSTAIVNEILKNEHVGNENKSSSKSEVKLKFEKSPSIVPTRPIVAPIKNHLEAILNGATSTRFDESETDSQCGDDLDNEDKEDDSESNEEYDLEQIGFKSQCTIYKLDSVSTSISEISDLMKEETQLRQKMRSDVDRLKFKVKIESSKDKLAEEELQTEISKKSFSQMEIIGQFNLGFIIVKLEDDLFIVDQHATDEKFNYETLQKETNLYNQKLVVPQSLELTAVSEMILIDNIDVFEKNGFKFQIDHNAPPTKKVQLTAKPMSKHWEFGKGEIDELIFLLQESPNTVLRPSKISSMFASRACRKSVMIGTSLSMSDMQRLIRQMGEIEQPWNCPHGRPTMRHLINWKMLENVEDDD